MPVERAAELRSQPEPAPEPPRDDSAPSPPPSAASEDGTADGPSPTRRRTGSGESGRKTRNKFYACTTPVSPALPRGEWTELRRFVAADVQVRQQSVRGMESMLPLGASYWSREVAEMAARQDSDPAVFGERNLRRLRDGLSLLDVSLQPGEIVTDREPAYYRWTQWLFLQLYRRGLVRLASPGVTGQLEGPQDSENGSLEAAPGRSAAGDEDRWMLRLTQYGERLINDLGKSSWRPEEKTNQRHRLGRLRGCDLLLQVSHYFRTEVDELKVFSSRVETIYGATFVLVHPWHPILPAVVEESYEEEVGFYRDRVERNQEPRLSGVRTGGFAINPATLARIPVLVSRLAMDPDCGGAILGVPAHDALLYQLAERVKLPIREVVRGNGVKRDVRGKLQEPYLGDGNLTNSGPFSGTATRAARDRIINFLGRRGICRRSTRFFFDWLPVSQRSIWGVPVPIIHCPACGIRPVPERDLPVSPPRIRPGDLRAAGLGGDGSSESSPKDLSSFERFVPVSCPECKGRARRDTHTIADWLGKSWMPLRHALPELEQDVPGWRSAPGAGESSESEGAIEDLESSAGNRSVQSLSNEDLDHLALFGEAGTEPAGGPGEDARNPDAEEIAGSIDDGAAGEASEGRNAESAAGDAPREESGPTEIRGDDSTSASRTAPSSPGTASDGDEEVANREPQGAGPGDPSDEDTSADEEEDDLDDDADDDADDDDDDADETFRDAASDASRVQPFRRPGVRHWLSVDLGLGSSGGGAMEVLWSRFVTKFLYDLREIPFYEPFYRFVRVGDVDEDGDRVAAGGDEPAEDGAEGPDAGSPLAARRALPPVESLVEKHGSDAVRIGLLSRGDVPCRVTLPESELLGIGRLLRRTRRNISMRLERGKFVSRRVLVEKHRLIRCVTENMRSMRFHKAIAGIRAFVKFLHCADIRDEEMDRGSVQMFLVVLFPFAPKLATELWAETGAAEPIERQGWPEASEELLQSEEVEIPVQLNGRVALKLRASAELDANALRDLALADEKVREKLSGRQVERVVAVPGRVVNLLVESGVES